MYVQRVWNWAVLRWVNTPCELSNRCPVNDKCHVRSVFSWKFKANSYDDGCSTSCLQIMNLKTAFWVVRTPSSCSYQQSRRQITSWHPRCYKNPSKGSCFGVDWNLWQVLMGENNHSGNFVRRHYEYDIRCNKAYGIVVMEKHPFGSVIKSERPHKLPHICKLLYSRLWWVTDGKSYDTEQNKLIVHILLVSAAASVDQSLCIRARILC